MASPQPATSPTYALVHRYQGARGPVFHLDCFRLRSPDEAADLDWEGLLSEGDAILIEWPERAGGLDSDAHPAIQAAALARSGRRGLDVALMLLAIDTATDRASVALGAAGSEPLEENLAGARRHASALLPMIQALLRRAAASLDDVRGIVLSDGPGSFTGLRVGASVAKALVQARGVPLWVAPSLLVRAAGVAQDNQLVLAVSSALRGELYAAAYRFLGAEIHTELIPSVRRPDELDGGVAPARSGRGRSAGRYLCGAGGVGGPASDRAAAMAPPMPGELLRLVGRPGGARRVEAAADWEPVYGTPG